MYCCAIGLFMYAYMQTGEGRTRPGKDLQGERHDRDKILSFPNHQLVKVVILIALCVLFVRIVVLVIILAPCAADPCTICAHHIIRTDPRGNGKTKHICCV